MKKFKYWLELAWGNSAYITFFIALAAVMFFAVPAADDSAYWSLQKLSIEAIKVRLGISARVLNEIPLVIYSSNFWLFRILFLGMWFVTAICTEKLFVREVTAGVRWAIVLLILTYPLTILSEAGWAATASNYTFAYPLFLTGFCGFYKCIKKEAFKKWEYGLYIGAMFLGTNQEQLACIGFLTAVLLLTYTIYSQRKVHLYPCLLTLVPAISLIWFLFVAPSAASRGGLEVRWFIDWESMSFVRKVILGYQHAASTLFYNYNGLFTAVNGIVAVRVFQLRKDIVSRILALVPIAIVLEFAVGLFGTGPTIVERILNTALITITPDKITSMVGIINVTNYQYIATYLAFIIPAVGLICMTISIFNAFEEILIGLFGGFMFCMAFISSVILGFSPTVWASEQRTNFFMMMIIMQIGVMAFEKIYHDNQRLSKGILIFISMFAVNSYLVTLELMRLM